MKHLPQGQALIDVIKLFRAFLNFGEYQNGLILTNTSGRVYFLGKVGSLLHRVEHSAQYK